MTNKHWITLNLKNRADETPEVRKYLDAVAEEASKDFPERLQNLMIYGTTHPEIYEKKAENEKQD